MKLTEAYAYVCSVLPTWSEQGKGSRTASINYRHCLRILGDVEVESIDSDCFTTIQHSLLSDGKENATVNKVTTALRTILNTLKRREKLQRNVPYFESLPEPKGRTKYYSDEEVLQMLEHTHRIDDGQLVHDCILFACLTGARQGEILKLQWSDVFLDEGELVFRDTKNKGEDRWLPITEELHQHLTAMQHHRIDDGPLFDIHPSSLLRRIRKLQKFAGITDTEKNFHTFRHTTATKLFSKGAELPVVMEVLGHANAKTTMRYAHATREGMRRALATL